MYQVSVMVWSSSSALVIGFYQAAPYSETFKIFYKKVGAVFGTQVTLTPVSILGPELAVRQPMLGEAQYFEYEIKKLKPSTQYVVKIKTNDDSCEVRSDKMVTISREEERTRDNDMANFVGALVKLGDYDGVVVSYASGSGIFGIRILQIDDVASSLQLARLTSDYTDSGVPVQAYTLSQVRFGRWGGAITGSKVVNEGELKWLVARAVQLGDKSDAAAAYEARQRMLQAQVVVGCGAFVVSVICMYVERVTMSLEVEWSHRFRSLRTKSLTSLALLALVIVAAVAGMGLMLGAAGQREQDLEARLAAGGVRQAELEAELQILHLYRVSLELDVERRLALSESRSGSSGGHGSKFGTGDQRANSSDTYLHGAGNNTTNAAGGGGFGGSLLDAYIAATAFHNGTLLAADGATAGDRKASSSSSSSTPSSPSSSASSALRPRKSGSSSNGKGKRKADNIQGTAPPAEAPKGGGSGGSSKAQFREGKGVPGKSAAASSQSGPDLWGLPQQALWAALERSRAGRLSLMYGNGGGATTAAELEDPQPDAWTFIHYVSHVYALHLQEWMKVQLQKTVRRKVNDMLLPEERSTEGGYSGGGGDDVGGVAVGGADGVRGHQGGGGGGGGGGRDDTSSGEDDVIDVHDSEYDEYDQDQGLYYY
ncbi:hypothetical protein VOLCADRAFT_91763 [Volvox carteri f. nagariensis]|uniref:Uncharacterized protein n=1 Tax=Volvox carteri f. nagariensis TaxID=3068 RepID=D8TXW7_VOLCA|nr:uncharacterized protein VOLCADRAFT_91763 [Volvox carteri f. nagariensis]EFJ47792.1 hypothetical protein VOLCADRAFT_91763 [Volvox carteri f. nagariensis]|eukprot:XP_002951263.1 hypothetical protein VOLCADRAFT_91763 [Volvox carteri f. nagariensis]